jgi:hypothetical protein
MLTDKLLLPTANFSDKYVVHVFLQKYNWGLELHHQRAHMHIVYSFYQKPEEK